MLASCNFYLSFKYKVFYSTKNVNMLKDQLGAINFKEVINLLHDSKFYYIICADMSGNYSYINTHYAQKFNHIDTELVGKPYYITMHPDDRKICEEVGAECIMSPEKSFPATIRKHNGMGGYLVTQWEYRAMFESGELKGIFCLGYDITEFENQKEVLYQQVQRLDEIAFQQSHLVRGPLSAIMGIVSILKNMSFDENTKSLFNMLQESSENLDKVIKDIVDKTN